jgi:soluble lytic murein transglycosylase
MRRLVLILVASLISVSGNSQNPDTYLNKFSAAHQAYNKKTSDALEKLRALQGEEHTLKPYVQFFLADLLLMDQSKKENVQEAEALLEQVVKIKANNRLVKESEFKLSILMNKKNQFAQSHKILVGLEKELKGLELHPNVLYELAIAEKGLMQQQRFCRVIKKLYERYPQYDKIVNWTLNLMDDQFEGKPTNCPVTAQEKRNRIRTWQLSGLGKRAKAELDYLKSSKGDNDKFELDKLEVYYLLSEGEPLKALQIMLPYFQSKKNSPEYLMMLGNVASRAGEYQAAVGAYYGAYKLNPKAKVAKDGLFQSGFMSYQIQDYDGSTRKFQEFLKVYPKSKLAADAKWQLAWISYLKANYRNSITVLTSIAKSSRSGVNERIKYWIAMSHLKLGETTVARKMFEEIANSNIFSYYAIAAQNRLQKLVTLSPKSTITRSIASNMSLANRNLSDTVMPIEWVYDDSELISGETVTATEDRISETADEPTDQKSISPFNNELFTEKFNRAKLLVSANLNEWAKWELYEIEKHTSSAEYLKSLMEIYTSIGVYHRSALIADQAFGPLRMQLGPENGKIYWESSFPKAYQTAVEKSSKDFGVPQELIWGIMKAESRFKKDAVSPVGALGLMQVMPYTGEKVSHLLKEKNFDWRNLLNSDFAVRYGSRYLKRLMVKFDEAIPLVAAGYNAGPHRVKSWVKSFGNLDMDEFIEHIPFFETRNYVKKVVAYSHAYNQMYFKKNQFLSALSSPITFRVTEPVIAKESWDDIY